MELQITVITPTNDAYIMNNGIGSFGSSGSSGSSWSLGSGTSGSSGTSWTYWQSNIDIEIRVVYAETFITFHSNITGVTGMKLLKGDSNPNAEYYNINIPVNSTGEPRLVQVYGRPIRSEPSNGVLILSVMQNG